MNERRIYLRIAINQKLHDDLIRLAKQAKAAGEHRTEANDYAAEIIESFVAEKRLAKSIT